MADLLGYNQAQTDLIVDAIVFIQGPIPEGKPAVLDGQGNEITPAVPKETPQQFARRMARGYFKSIVMNYRREQAVKPVADAAIASAATETQGM